MKIHNRLNNITTLCGIKLFEIVGKEPNTGSLFLGGEDHYKTLSGRAYLVKRRYSDDNRGVTCDKCIQYTRIEYTVIKRERVK